MTVVSAPVQPAASPEAERASGRLSLKKRIWRDRAMLLMALPGVIYFVVFHYVPLLGYVIAFQNYKPFLGFSGSPWVGWDNFAYVIKDEAFWNALLNTLEITFLQLILFFPAPIVLALILNDLLHEPIKRVIQSVVYLPHFIGWVIIVAIAHSVLGGTGPVAAIAQSFGHDINLMTDGGFFPWLVTLELIWKNAGWGTIIYLAALSGIPQELYEAAAVDGAGRWHRTWHVTLPGLMPITVLLLILQLGSILSVGFEQILLQRDNVGARAGEVLDTYVYFHGIINGQWGSSAAVGLVKGLIGTVLVLVANRMAHAVGQTGIFQSAKGEK